MEVVPLQEIGDDSDDFDMESTSDKQKRRKREREAQATAKKRKYQNKSTRHGKIEGDGGSFMRDEGAIPVVGSAERKLLGLLAERDQNSETVCDLVIRGVRLGDKAVGKKSKFAGFDGMENRSDVSPAIRKF